MATADNLTGQSIRGYELRHQIGIGGFGAVYNAFQAVIEREVAVKVVHPRFANQIEFIRRFEIEARLVARLEHMNIVPLYDFWRDPAGAFLVMRWLRGGNVRDLLDRYDGLPVETVVKILNQTAAALATAHANGVIHRDIKPENILLDENQNAYLSDFGIAIDILNDPDEVMLRNLSFGSPAYMSPEQIMGKGSTPQADVYSLGILIYEMLTARNPFPNDTTQALLQKQVQFAIPSLKETRPELSSEMDTIIWKATAKSPDARYKDTLTLAAAFEQAALKVNKNMRTFTTRDANPSDRRGATMPLYIENQNIDTQRLGENSTVQLGANVSAGDTDTDIPSTVPLEGVIRNPYKGLRAFEELDAGDFFGRRSEIDRLLSRLSDTKRRFMAVIGPSGSGKSSLVRAGVLAELRNGTVEGSGQWLIVSMLPGDQPFEKLAEALLRVAVEDEPNLASRLQANSTRLHQFVQKLVTGKAELVLFIDQFEELFTQTSDETVRGKFLESLHYAATQGDSRLRILVTLRADFYDRPLQYKVFGELLRENTEIVLPLSPAELEETIVGPAQLAGLLLEPGLSKVIVEDIYQQPGALPLLQFALSQLFEGRAADKLTHEAYQSIGGVSGALARRAEETYLELPANAQSVARQLFLRLIVVGENSATRKRVMWADLFIGLNATAKEVIDRFAQHRLLTFDHDPITRTPTIEIAHEALIKEWQRLQNWIEENRVDLQKRQRLAAMAGDWLNAERDDSFLVSGSRLIEFEPLMTEAIVPLNRDEQTFIAESTRLREQGVRRTQGVIAALAIFLLIAIGFALFAVDRQRQAQVAQTRAEQETQMSRSRELAATGLSEQRRNDLSLLLSVASLDTGDTYEARNSLLTALQTHPSLSAYLYGHGSAVRSVAYSSDGTKIVSGDEDGTVIRWDATTRQSVGEVLTGHTAEINDTAYSPDNRWIASASSDGTVRLWDAATGEAATVFEQHEGTVWSVTFDPEGMLVASGDENGTLLIWEAETGEIVHTIEDAHDGILYDLAIAGTLLASGGADNMIRLWDLETGEAVGDALEAHQNWVLTLTFNPAGNLLVSSGADAQIIVWDVENQSVALSFESGHTNWVRSLAFIGLNLVTASADGTIRVWDIIEQELVVPPLQVHREAVWSIAASTEGSGFVSASADGTLLMWDLPQAPRPAVETLLVGADVSVVALNTAGSHIAVAGTDGNLRVWTPDTVLDDVAQLWQGHTGAVTDLEYRPDGLILASSSVDGSIILWDVDAGEALLEPLTAHQAIVEALAFNEMRLFSADANGRVIEWDTQTGEQVGEPIASELPGILSLTLSRDARLLAMGGRDGTIRIWDVRTGQFRETGFNQHSDAVTSLIFSADDEVLISASRDGRILLWNVETGELAQQPLVGHSDWILSLALSPDHQMLVSAGRDNTIILWDFATGRALGRPLTGHSDWVNSIQFSPDSRWLYSGSRDATIIRWSVELDDWKAQACAIANRRFTPGEWAQYFTQEVFQPARYCGE